jgi:hypothetical protein
LHVYHNMKLDISSLFFRTNGLFVGVVCGFKAL